jgi:hypothetical protein
MSERKIKISISPLGAPTIEAQGFNGQGCTDATKAIETALAGGQGGITREMKPEWFNSNDASQDEQEHVRW